MSLMKLKVNSRGCMELGCVCSRDTVVGGCRLRVGLRTLSQLGLWQELMDTAPLLPQEWDFTNCL